MLALGCGEREEDVTHLIVGGMVFEERRVYASTDNALIVAQLEFFRFFFGSFPFSRLRPFGV